MKAIVCSQYGPPDVLQLKEVDKPIPQDDEILIRNCATSVTAADYRIRGLNVPTGFGILMRLAMGFRKPRIPILGMNFAGSVVTVGKQVTQFKPGDKVFGTTGMRFGAYAEYICAAQSSTIATMPDNMTYEQAAALPFGALSALSFLKDKGHIQKDENVLIYGASGAVGTAAVQLAKYFGAQVTGVCSTANLQLVQSLGADHVIDYTHEDFTQRSERYDIIMDTVGKTPYTNSLRSLTVNGRYLLLVAGIPRYFRLLWPSMVGRKKVIAGVAGESKEDLLLIKDLFKDGILKSVIDKQYPLEQTSQAHAYAEKGHKIGNIVITIH